MISFFFFSFLSSRVHRMWGIFPTCFPPLDYKRIYVIIQVIKSNIFHEFLFWDTLLQRLMYQVNCVIFYFIKSFFSLSLTWDSSRTSSNFVRWKFIRSEVKNTLILFYIWSFFYFVSIYDSSKVWCASLIDYSWWFYFYFF